VQFARVERLDAGLRADGHEHGRVHNTMRSGQFSQTRFCLRIGFEEFKHRAKDNSKVARLKMKSFGLANLNLAGASPARRRRIGTLPIFRAPITAP
jgi:hypothetical protein